MQSFSVPLSERGEVPDNIRVPHREKELATFLINRIINKVSASAVSFPVVCINIKSYITEFDNLNALEMGICDDHFL